MDRPIGTFLLLWPTLWALWLAAEGRPDPDVVVIFILGTFVMRAAGCAINDFADRDFDAHVARTRGRPLATGELNPSRALITFGILLLLAFLLVLLLNRETVLLSLFGALVAAIYPFTKRLTHLPQLVLGVAFSWGIPMAYTATGAGLGWETLWLFAANFAWIVAYDTQYAMSDREDDLVIGVKSTAILFGRHDNLAVGLLHCLALLLLCLLGVARDLSWHFFAGLAGAALVAAYQQYLCRERDRELCFQAFRNNNWFGAIVFSGLLLAQLAP
jgi:4-hydroxybenzoate polyprenyltransferase